MKQTTGDAWLCQELDALKRRAGSCTLPDEQILEPEAKQNSRRIAEADEPYVANPYFP